MKQILFFGAFVTIVVVGLYNIVNLYDSNMKWGRMHDTPAVRPHEEPLLIMEAGTVPFNGGEELIRASIEDNSLVQTFQSNQTMIVNGKKEYQVFCSHCHGNNLDGLGTVGQSFNPLPPNLISQQIAQLSDNELFSRISYGGNRAPALASSMTVQSRWAVVNYIRSRQTSN